MGTHRTSRGSMRNLKNNTLMIMTCHSVHRKAHTAHGSGVGSFKRSEKKRHRFWVSRRYHVFMTVRKAEEKSVPNGMIRSRNVRPSQTLGSPCCRNSWCAELNAKSP